MVQWMGWATYMYVVCNKVRLTDILITLAAWATRFADYWMRTESFQSLSQPHSQPRSQPCSQPHSQPRSQPHIHPLASLPPISLASTHQPRFHPSAVLHIHPKFTVSQPASHLGFQLFSQPCYHPASQLCFHPNYTVSQPASQPCF